MSKGLIFSGLGIAFGTLAWFGRKKYLQVQALNQLKVTPGSPALTLKTVTDSLMDGSVNLIIDNPTEYDFHLKNFSASIQSANSKVALGQFQLAEAKLFARTKNPVNILTVIQFQQVLDLAKDIFFSASATIFLTGTITYESSGLEVPYPFSFQVDLQDQLKQILSKS